MFATLLATALCLASAVYAAPIDASAATVSQRSLISNLNNWNCKASNGKDPVIMLHGLGAPSGLNWFAHAPPLAAEGYCVFTPQYGTKLGVFLGWKSMRDSSKEVAGIVDKVLASTGATKVNLVGHSMGTTVGTYYMKFDGGAPKVNHFVGFGANYKGTTLYGLNLLVKRIPGVSDAVRAVCDSCDEFLPPSQLIQDLNAGGVSVPGPDYTTIVSRLDEVVVPYTSGLLEGEAGVTNIVLQDGCTDLAGHIAQAADFNVLNIIKWALAGKQGARPKCVPWLIPGRRAEVDAAAAR